MQENRKQLYICERPYPMYRTIIKAVTLNTKPDIVISNHVDGMEKIPEPLYESKLFQNIFFYNDTLYRKYQETICPDRNFMKNIFTSLKKLKAYFNLIKEARDINIKETIDINGYDEIFVNDATSTLCMYLFHNKKKVTWVEHAKDTYKMKSTISFRLAYKILLFLEILRITFALHGFSRHVNCLEINSIGKLYCVPKNKKIVIWNIDEAMKSLPSISRNIVYSIYEKAYNIEIKENKKYDLILTRPLYFDRVVGSMEEQINIFENVIKKYNEKGRGLIIKPHPRDDYDYSKGFRDAVVIDRSVSSEILTLNENLSLTNAISFESSSLNVFGEISEELIQIREKDLKQYL